MRAKIMGKTIEIPDERMRKGGVEGHATLKAQGRTGSGYLCSPESTGPSSQLSSLAPSSLPGWPKPTDKWNYGYAMFLERERGAGRIKYWWYEPFAMWLPGEVRYRPDFLIQYPDGLERKLEFVEVKGYSRNLRDGITRYKIAAALFPCFSWRMVKRERGGWVDY